MWQHNLEPVALQLGPIAIHWYGIMYLVSFLGVYGYLKNSKRFRSLGLPGDAPETILLLGILGVLVGGRLGYVLFYEPLYYLKHPFDIVAVWQGGMSFHGGLIGVLAAFWRYVRKEKKSLLVFFDVILPIVPIGLFLGRIGNFINGELYGRVTQHPLCVYFPDDSASCRYPSQLFEALLEGLVLLGALFLIARYAKKRGTVTASFLMLYGLFRFGVEFFREPDAQIGYYWDVLTQGQLLSIAMIIAGVVLWRKRPLSLHTDQTARPEFPQRS